jgi:hypothetical protein
LILRARKVDSFELKSLPIQGSCVPGQQEGRRPASRRAPGPVICNVAQSAIVSLNESPFHLFDRMRQTFLCLVLTLHIMVQKNDASLYRKSIGFEYVSLGKRPVHHFHGDFIPSRPKSQTVSRRHPFWDCLLKGFTSKICLLMHGK